MNYMTIFIVAIGLAMDAFAVSITTGITTTFRMRHAAILGLFCGAFQFIMPLIGWLMGHSVSSYAMQFGNLVAFILLLIIGGKMIYSSLTDGSSYGKREQTKSNFSIYKCITLAVATSIDALAVGVSIAFFEINIISTCAIIGIVAFCFSFLGGLLGKKIGSILQDKAELIGGIILVLIGLRILLSS